MQDRVSREIIQTGEWEVLMIIDYDGRPNATDEERLRSLRDSVQRALNDIDTTILNLQKNGSVDVSELLAAKQDILVSGQNIKTVNNKSLLGSGNINIEGGGGTGGTYDHTELDNRGAANQHPMSAITGLQAALNSKSDEGHTHSQYLTEHQDISGKQDVIGDLDSIRSGAAAGSTALQSEVDPTVPAWAKTPDKPTYTAAEVGALPDDTVIPTVPTNVSAFANDAGYITQNIKVINADSAVIPYATITRYVDEYDDVLLNYGGRTYRYFGIVSTYHYFTATYYTTIYYYRVSTSNANSSGSRTVPATSSTYSASSTSAMTGIAVAQALKTIDVPTKTSDLENDSGFLTEHQSLDGYVQTDDSRLSDARTPLAHNHVVNDITDFPEIPGPTTVDQVLTSGTEIAKVNNISLFAPQGGGGGSDIGSSSKLMGNTTTALTLSTTAKNLLTVSLGMSYGSDGIYEFTPATGTIKILKDGAYFIRGCMYVTTGYTANDILHLIVYINGAVATQFDHVHRMVSTGYSTIEVTGLTPLVAGDTVQLFARNQTASRGSVQPSNVTQLNVIKLS